MSIEPLKVDDTNKDLILKLYKVYKTLNKMMDDRGYITTDIKNYEDWLKDVEKLDSMGGIYSKKNDKNKKLYYLYIPTEKINADCIKTFIGKMKDASAESGIIIVSGKMSQQAKQKIIDISSDLSIDIFTINDLVVNITEHELVPKHILLSNKDKEELLKRYKIKENQLPKILTTDPVAKYLGLKKGDVVKIIRKSETAGKYITYRIAC